MRLPGGSVVKSLTMQETQVRSLGWENPLEMEKATHSSIPAWEIPWIDGVASTGHNPATKLPPPPSCTHQFSCYLDTPVL